MFLNFNKNLKKRFLLRLWRQTTKPLAFLKSVDPNKNNKTICDQFLIQKIPSCNWACLTVSSVVWVHNGMLMQCCSAGVATWPVSWRLRRRVLRHRWRSYHPAALDGPGGRRRRVRPLLDVVRRRLVVRRRRLRGVRWRQAATGRP